MKQDRKFRPDIEGLRAVAILLVVIAHAGLGLKGGYVGVDVFFVISGFLITRILYGEFEKTGRISFLNFYARRVRRILPAATVVLLATLIASWVWLSPLRQRDVAVDGAFTAISAINYRLAASGTNYFANTTPSPLQHYWSLAVEEQFYLIWPLLILGLGLLAGKRFSHRKATSVALAVIIAGSLLASYKITALSAPWAYFGLQTRAWELALGALIAINTARLARLPTSIAAVGSWLGLAAIIVSAVIFNDNTLYPGLAAALPVFGAGVLIAAGTVVSTWSAERLLALKQLQFGGKVSYSWYLWHWPLLVLLPIAAGRALFTMERVFVVVIALLLSIATFYAVENPLRNSKRLKKRLANTFVFGLTLVAISLALATVMFITAPKSSKAAQVTKKVQQSHSQAEVLSAVLAATKASQIAGDVTPSLVDAPNDQYGCLANKAATGPTSKNLCILGNPHSKKTVVLYGDSHAWQWTKALSDIAAKRNWRLVTMTKSGCPIGDDPIIDAQFKRAYTECYKWRAAEQVQLKRFHPQVIVLASLNYPSTTTGAFTKFIQTQQKRGSKVVYILDTPHPSVNIPDCLAKNTTQYNTCAMSTKAAIRFPDKRVALQKAAIKTGATIINPVPWFCANQTCPPVIADHIVYFDDSHISVTYSQYLEPLLDEQLTPLQQ